MNKKKIILIVVAIAIVLSPLIIGLFLPKERLITKKAFIDKMYFFILSDITNHFEEPSWRTNLDTMLQKPQVDGMDAWMEYYHNGDSILLLTQVTSGTDYIRLVTDNNGEQHARSIVLVDVKGKTAIRMSEEVIENNPIKRFLNLFNDKTAERLDLYLKDLTEKHKPKEGEEENNAGF